MTISISINNNNHLNDNANNKEHKHYLNEGEENEMEIEGFRKVVWAHILSWIAILISFGILGLLFMWYPYFYLYCTHKKCHIKDAQKVLITDVHESYKTYFIKDIKHKVLYENSFSSERDLNQVDNHERDTSVEVHSARAYFKDGSSTYINYYKMIKVKKLIYIWIEEKRNFISLAGLGPGKRKCDLHSYDILRSADRQAMHILYGGNKIKVPVQPILTLFVKEILRPYYVFQIFMMGIWIAEQYLYYLYAIIILTIFGIIVTVIQTHRGEARLRKLVEASESFTALIFNDNMPMAIPSKDLTIGDIIIIPDNEEYTMPCDAVILSGSCVVNESTLTGESIPLRKVELNNSQEMFEEKECSSHILYCGTKVIQTRRDKQKQVHALVLRTGYLTAKGDLVKCILYPPPVDYEFEKSVYTLIYFTTVAAVIISITFASIAVTQPWSKNAILFRSLTLVVLSIPSAVPGLFALCKMFAIRRLRKNSIFCIDDQVLNVAGSINTVCFDKTGTITEEGLDVWGVVPTSGGTFHQTNMVSSEIHSIDLKYALATCHSLSVINGKIMGDMIDVKMFEWTKWIFDEANETLHYPIIREEKEGSKVLELVQQYQFSSTLQRMSVIIRNNDSRLVLFCKGSPEMLATLSTSSSVPSNLMPELEKHTKKGYRVLALAWRELVNVQSIEELKLISRNDLEKDLCFEGLLVFENKVKQQSKPVIHSLLNGDFKITMLTGDNIQTAIHVAKECDIILKNEDLIEIDELNGNLVTSNTEGETSMDDKSLEIVSAKKEYKIALTGKAWQIIKTRHKKYLPHILCRTAVFARMASNQKQQVVTELQNLGRTVVMCGDGANDCAALKASNVGISLSAAEASVASALSSTVGNISCVLDVIQEGRASLTTAFGLFKFLLLYSYIELCSFLICYSTNNNMSDFQGIWQDIFLILQFSLFYGMTEPYKGELVRETPVATFISLIPLVSIFIQIFVTTVFQIIALLVIRQYPWYVSGSVVKFHLTPNSLDVYSYDNYAIYSIAVFQYITTVVVFIQGPPYRKSLYTNIPLVFSLVVMTALTVCLVVVPPIWVQKLFVLLLPPTMGFRYLIVGLAAINFILSMISEKIIVQYLLFKKYLNSSFYKTKLKDPYNEALKKSSQMLWVSNLIDTSPKLELMQQDGM